MLPCWHKFFLFRNVFLLERLFLSSPWFRIRLWQSVSWRLWFCLLGDPMPAPKQTNKNEHNLGLQCSHFVIIFTILELSRPDCKKPPPSPAWVFFLWRTKKEEDFLLTNCNHKPFNIFHHSGTVLWFALTIRICNHFGETLILWVGIPPISDHLL